MLRVDQLVAILPHYPVYLPRLSMNLDLDDWTMAILHGLGTPFIWTIPWPGTVPSKWLSMTRSLWTSTGFRLNCWCYLYLQCPRWNTIRWTARYLKRWFRLSHWLKAPLNPTLLTLAALSSENTGKNCTPNKFGVVNFLLVAAGARNPKKTEML